MPVLALTASVLDDDARRCREAGMDDVLAKPLSLATLRQALLRWLPRADGVEDDQAAVDSDDEPDGDEGLPDLATLQRRFGSREIARQLRDSLLKASDEDIAVLQRALHEGDGVTAALHLHRQAGALGAVGAQGLADRANALVERLQAAGEEEIAMAIAEAGQFVVHLQQQLQRLAH